MENDKELKVEYKTPIDADKITIDSIANVSFPTNTQYYKDAVLTVISAADVTEVVFRKGKYKGVGGQEKVGVFLFGAKSDGLPLIGNIGASSDKYKAALPCPDYCDGGLTDKPK